MPQTPFWMKKLGGHAGELFVCAELSKRAVPNALLPENFSDDDILISDMGATKIGFIQVKACHPDRSRSFILKERDENWTSASDNQFCVFVWLGKPSTSEPPRYWIAGKREVGEVCVSHRAHGTTNWERRFHVPPALGEPQGRVEYLLAESENRWLLFDAYRPQ